MKKTSFAFGLLGLLVLFLGSVKLNTAHAQVTVSIGVFYDALAPYGEWFEYGDYGYCWRPTVVESGWRPYTHGHWVWTDYGWTWGSDYVWGWAPFHYGRWVYDDYYGWIWVPDNVWGPAWVQWRYRTNYIGWAPLPPRARWGFSIGASFDDYGVVSFGWCFVHSWGFLAPRVAVLPYAYNTTIIRNTVNITSITIVSNRIYNHGPRVGHVERATGRRVFRTPVYEDRSVPEGRRTAERIENGRLYVYKPEVTRDRDIRDVATARSSNRETRGTVERRGNDGGTGMDKREGRGEVGRAPSFKTDRSQRQNIQNEQEYKGQTEQRGKIDRTQRNESPGWLAPDTRSKEGLRGEGRRSPDIQRNRESEPKDQPKNEMRKAPAERQQQWNSGGRERIERSPESRSRTQPRVPSEIEGSRGGRERSRER